MNKESVDFALEPNDSERLANLCGQFDSHLHQIENALSVKIANRGNVFNISGEPKNTTVTKRLLQDLYQLAENKVIAAEQIHLLLKELSFDENNKEQAQDDVSIRTKRGLVRGRSPNQKRYLSNLVNHDINFAVGPAGTGKTYLAVAYAIECLQTNRIQRLILTRPAVEAGERLGFLPGDMAQKVDPFLRPLYDALYEMLGFEKVERLIERNVIEIAPLAFMRGRTLNDAFVILDEAQNSTPEQMKMFLTRIGYGSIAIITGDITQIDLPNHKKSGLKQAISLLKDIEKISFSYFGSKDVVRHPLVQKIIESYAAHEEKRVQDKE